MCNAAILVPSQMLSATRCQGACQTLQPSACTQSLAALNALFGAACPLSHFFMDACIITGPDGNKCERSLDPAMGHLCHPAAVCSESVMCICRPSLCATLCNAFIRQSKKQ